MVTSSGQRRIKSPNYSPDNSEGEEEEKEGGRWCGGDGSGIVSIDDNLEESERLQENAVKLWYCGGIV